jgi:hypothetical membrane protein
MVDARKVAGTYLFVGAAQFVVGMMIAEAVYPGYSISGNFISDLGVGPAAPIFNASVALLGVFVLAAAYFLRKSFLPRTTWGTVVTVFFVLAGAGAVGVGIFTEDAGAMHTVVSLVTFLFGSLAAIATFTLVGPPLRYLSLVLGVASLLALVLFGAGEYAGIGKGGMERMIAYPILLWAMGFGGYLMKAPPLRRE